MKGRKSSVIAGELNRSELNMTDTPIAFRDAVRGDASRIVKFQILMARETEGIELDRPTCERGVEAVFDDSSLGRYFVAEIEGLVVASLMITYEWSDWRAGTVWWIQSVFVEPGFRQRGIYAGLYEHVRLIFADDASVRGVRLYVDRSNDRAQAVYRRLGMNGDHYLVFEWMKD